MMPSTAALAILFIAARADAGQTVRFSVSGTVGLFGQGLPLTPVPVPQQSLQMGRCRFPPWMRDCHVTLNASAWRRP